MCFLFIYISTIFLLLKKKLWHSYLLVVVEREITTRGCGSGTERKLITTPARRHSSPSSLGKAKEMYPVGSQYANSYGLDVSPIDCSLVFVASEKALRGEL